VVEFKHKGLTINLSESDFFLSPLNIDNLGIQPRFTKILKKVESKDRIQECD